MSLPSLLMLADSAFPSGAFGHSFGLETAIDEGRAVDERGVGRWIERYSRESLATLDAAAFVLAARDGVDAIELDEQLHASIFACEARRANAHMAAALLDAFAAMGLDSAAMRRYRAALAAGDASGIHALAFALGTAAAGIGWRESCEAYVSSALGALVAAATRAIPLGQRASVRLLWRMRPLVETVVARAAEAHGVDDLCAQAFEAEIDAMEHVALDGRMFAS